MILFTGPSWCAPCKALDDLMTDSMKAKLRIVDPKLNQALASQHGVQTVPTLVNTDDGSKVSGPHHILSFLKKL